MKWIIRHSEKVSPSEHKGNKYDVPLTKNGMKIAISAIKDIINVDDLKGIKFIYCSPFTRCMQTAKFIQNYLETSQNIHTQIRIENGLSEVSVYKFNQFIRNHRKIVNGKLSLMNSTYADSSLKAANIYKKYNTCTFDTKYKSFIPFKNIQYLDRNAVDGWNYRIKAIKKIWSTERNRPCLVITHGNAMKTQLIGITGKIDEIIEEKFKYDSWCITMGFVK